jgi:hypothetical protein
MDQTDRWRARLELEIDRSTLKDLENLEEGKYRLERMDNTVRRCIRTSQELMEDLMNAEANNLDSIVGRRGTQISSYYYVEKGPYQSSHRRYSSGLYSSLRQPDRALKRQIHPGIRSRNPLNGQFKSAIEISDQIKLNNLLSNSVDDKVRRIKQQNNRLKAMILTGKIPDTEFFRDDVGRNQESCAGCRGSSKDEMTSHQQHAGSRNSHAEESFHRSALDEEEGKNNNICTECREAIIGIKGSIQRSSLEKMKICGICNHQSNQNQLQGREKNTPSRKGSIRKNEEIELETVKKQNTDRDTLIELVREQKELIDKLNKKLDDKRPLDALFRPVAEGSYSNSKNKSKTNNFPLSLHEGDRRSLRVDEYENPDQMSPVFGKHGSRPQDMSFENSKSLSRLPNSNQVIHFQDGLSRINQKENSCESLQDIELKIHSLSKVHAENGLDQSPTEDGKRGQSTACTAAEADRTKGHPRADGRQFVKLKPYSSRDGLKKKLRSIPESAEDLRRGKHFKKSKEKEPKIKYGSKDKKEKDEKRDKSAKKSTRKDDKERILLKKSKDKVLTTSKNSSPKKGILFKKLFSSEKQKYSTLKKKFPITEPLTRASLDTKRVEGSKPIVYGSLKSREAPKATSIDRMFNSGALYGNSILNDNGFDSFNNGLIAYCFLKRKFAPQYKKQVDQVVDKIEDFLLAKKITQLIKLQNKLN